MKHSHNSALSGYQIRIWDVKSGSEICSFGGHADSIISVSFSPTGFILASGSNDQTVRLWSLERDIQAYGIKCNNIYQATEEQF